MAGGNPKRDKYNINVISLSVKIYKLGWDAVWSKSNIRRMILYWAKLDKPNVTEFCLYANLPMKFWFM